MRNGLGEFEEIVLLIVAAQSGEAYGWSITRIIEKKLQRSVTMSSVHTALYRLEDKGLVSSSLGGATSERGGRRKRCYSISALGKRALIEARDARSLLWNMIPAAIFQPD